MDHYIAYEGHCGAALAAMQRAYLPFVMKGINNPNVTEGTLQRSPITEADEEAWLDRMLKKSMTDHLFAVLYQDQAKHGDGYRYVGHTAIHRISYPGRHGVTGSILVEEGVHGKGCGTEAKLLLLHHAFHVTGLRKLTSEVKVFNGNSLGHLIKCGYKIIGRRKQHHLHNGRFIDELILEVFRSDFEAIWNTYQESKQLPKLTDSQRSKIEKELSNK